MSSPNENNKKPGREKNGDPRRESSSWSDDQKNREYYYDDSHGYETYVPEEDDSVPEEVDDLDTPKKTGPSMTTRQK